MYVKRLLQDVIQNWLYKGKIIILYGARQVGKTTLVKEILKLYNTENNYYNCEIINISEQLSSLEPNRLKLFFGDKNIIVLDEAHRVKNIGMVLKIFHDTYPDIQIIATGSSSFDIANRLNEPLTGRAIDFTLYPLSITELLQIHRTVDMPAYIERFLRFGMYPDMVDKSELETKILLDNLTSKYLFKDIYDFENLKKPETLVHLLQLLAFQIGSEVSKNELAVKLYINRNTVERYLDILEKAFVIFRLKAFSRNLRKEITKKEKIYFYDTGIRNSLIANYNALNLRNDTGQLWENFCVIERLKHNSNKSEKKNLYFWKSHSNKEIDLVEEYNGELRLFEFKWSEKKVKIPNDFRENYSYKEHRQITRNNFWDLLE
jgi:predicted AAA+ superfamily ATPase